MVLIKETLVDHELSSRPLFCVDSQGRRKELKMKKRAALAGAAALLAQSCTGFSVPAMRVRGVSEPACSGAAPEQGGLSRRAAVRTMAFGVTSFVLARPASAQLYVPTDGSELAPIAKDGKPSPVVLVPLLQAQEQLDAVAKLIESGDIESWKEAVAVLKRKPFTPTNELKRLFNAYTDNIYFSDSSRKNMYLDGSAMLGAGKSTFGFGTLSVGSGGASPEAKDTFTYLYRNEVLNNIDALTAGEVNLERSTKVCT